MSMGNIANPFSKKLFHMMLFSVSVTAVFTIYKNKCAFDNVTEELNSSTH